MDSSHSFLLPHTDFLARNQYELVGQKEVAVNLSLEGNVTVQIRIALFGFVVYFYVSIFFLAYSLIIPFSNSLSEKKLWPFAINLWSCIKDSKGCFHPFFKRLKNSAVLRLFNPLLRLDFRWKSPYRDWYLAWNIYGLFYIARQPFIARVSNCFFRRKRLFSSKTRIFRVKFVSVKSYWTNGVKQPGAKNTNTINHTIRKSIMRRMWISMWPLSCPPTVRTALKTLLLISFKGYESETQRWQGRHRSRASSGELS